jgi:hypothetical protein
MVLAPCSTVCLCLFYVVAEERPDVQRVSVGSSLRVSLAIFVERLFYTGTDSLDAS